jgi:hypothetical protein
VCKEAFAAFFLVSRQEDSAVEREESFRLVNEFSLFLKMAAIAEIK